MHKRWLAAATLACSANALVAPRPAVQLHIAAASQEPPPQPTLAAETLSGINVAFSLLSKAVACSAIVGVDPLAGLWSSVALVGASLVGGMRPGVVAGSAAVVAVPLGAVFTEYNESVRKQERYVFVQSGNSFVRRLIEIGVADYFFAEVLKGLRAGEIVSLEQPPADSIVESDAVGAGAGELASNPI